MDSLAHGDLQPDDSDRARSNPGPGASAGAAAPSEPEPLSPSQRLHHITGSYREILYLTAPLVLSSTGFMLMHIIDALFLSWYSEDAIAAVGPASMAGFLMMSFFLGVAGYTATFVAQYIGARQPERAGAAVWQGLYFALATGCAIALAGSVLAAPLFHWVKHAPEMQRLETQYFTIMCWSAPFSLLGSALSGFFSGRGDNRTLMIAQLTGLVVNGFLSYGAIFGRWGLPESGAAGAAAGSAVAQGVVALILGILFFTPAHQRRFATWRGRAWNRQLLQRLLYFGSFTGLRFVTEILAWTIFLFFVGRLGKMESAVTNIVWRLNGFAFFPLLGLSTAIATLVGHAQGAREPQLSERVTWRGMIISELWMLFAAALFVLIPRQFLAIFSEGGNISTEHFAQMTEVGVVLLKFVALYCVLDGLNIVFIGALQGAGDTRWTLCASVLLHLTFLLALLTMDHLKMDLYAFWTAATAFVMLQAFVWLARFKTGKWKGMRVIEGIETMTPPA